MTGGKWICMIAAGVLIAAGCTTPSPVTGRPDANVSTSGTTVKATEGPQPEKIPTPSPRDTIKH